ncbi:18487_t:CDS:10 [Gigaspora rosea]|nr:18487_t:CDS:10 [Gigaspora rosea]
MNFYIQAANILDKLFAHKGTIKSLTLADNVKEKKKMYALICETLKYKNVINTILDNSQIFDVEKKFPRNVAILLVHDLLFSPNGIKSLSNGPYKQTILRHEIRLRGELARLKIKMKVKNNKDLINSEIRESIVIPRYIRVNTLKTSIKKVIEHFQAKGFTHEEPTDDLKSIRPKTIREDKHLPNLLILPPNMDLHEDALYLSDDIILQDKASCIPAFICSPPLNSHVIDACAAPGNKTSHLSAIMQNTGKIWAIDLDKHRLNLLKNLIQKAGCKNVEAIYGSFLDIDPMDQKYSSVGYILLDPSCSGSGIINRLDHLIDTSSETQEQSDLSHKFKEQRLENLSEFQEKMILHAFKFRSVQKIVYSTCSIYAEENEHVIKRALDQTDLFVLANKDDILPSWTRRGISSEINDDKGIAEKFIRTSPNEDYTNGFFVACFVRKAVQPINTKTDGGLKSKKRKRKKDVTIIKIKDDDEWKVNISNDNSLLSKRSAINNGEKKKKNASQFN